MNSPWYAFNQQRVLRKGRTEKKSISFSTVPTTGEFVINTRFFCVAFSDADSFVWEREIPLFCCVLLCSRQRRKENLGDRPSLQTCRIFSPLLSVLDRAVEREKKSQKSRGRTHRQKGRLKFFFLNPRSPHFFSLSLSRLNCRKLKRRTFKECPPVFQHDYNIK